MWYNIILGVGILLLVISLVIFRKTLTFLRTSERAVATVIALERVTNSDGDTFKPIFRFTTPGETEIVIRNNASSSPPAWEVNEEVLMAYDPARPYDATVMSYLGAFGWTVVLMAIAMPMIVIGGGYHIAPYFLK